MLFDLTDVLVQQILFAMENQTVKSVVKADIPSVVPFAGKPDEENTYALPEWTSSDGFNLLESFVSDLHSPIVKEELRQVLASGRGVFRNFKNVIKAYPSIEKKWHLYKNKKMRDVIYQWYNALRESLGLEALEKRIEFADETDDLVLSDFIFQRYDSSCDNVDVENCLRSVLTESLEHSSLSFSESPSLKEAIVEVNRYHFNFGNPDLKSGFVCKTIFGDFSGCIIGIPFYRDSVKTVVVTAFFVLQDYRGLGIGKELLEKYLSELKNNGVHWIIFTNMNVPNEMQLLLKNYNFEEVCSSYVLDLYTH